MNIDEPLPVLCETDSQFFNHNGAPVTVLIVAVKPITAIYNTHEVTFVTPDGRVITFTMDPIRVAWCFRKIVE